MSAHATTASAVGGASDSFAMLVTARACQGVFAALLAPSALSLLTTTFSDPKERGKAFGVYGAVAASPVFRTCCIVAGQRLARSTTLSNRCSSRAAMGGMQG